MKSTWAFLVLFLASMCVIPVSASETAFYYYKNQPVPLTIDSSQVMIAFEGYSINDGMRIMLLKCPELAFDSSIQVPVEDFGLFDLEPGVDYDSLMTSLRGDEIVRSVNPVISVTEEYSEYVGETFVCKFAPFVTKAEIDSLATAYHLMVGSENEYMPGEYVLKTTKQTGYTTIETANLFNNLEQTVYSHPNFYAWLILDGYSVQDEYYLPYQNNVQKVVGLPGYEEGAWEITTGDTNVYIAVLDQGIAPHEDLDETHLFYGYDFERGYLDIYTLTPTDTNEFHGMNVTGLMMAKHNNLVSTSSIEGYPEPEAYRSVAGLAPDCHAFSARIIRNLIQLVPDTTLGRALGFAFRNGASVMNCSWTYLEKGPVDCIDHAIDSAYQYGRGGLGTIIVFSAGNVQYRDSTVRWPNSKENVLAVGAIRQDTDGIHSYSCHGPSVDLVAHSGNMFFEAPGSPYEGGIWSMDLMGSAGFNPRGFDGCGDMNDIDYDCTFAGTSAAAPLVAGTAALVISRRPDLTAAQVMDVLKYSAITDLQWGTITPPDPYYGYGRVNALRALVAVCRGDANNDKQLNTGDAVYLVNFLFREGPAPTPHPGMGDANCDGKLNVGDPVYLVNYVYRGGPAPGICYHYDY